MYECIQSLYSVSFLLFIGFTTDPGGGILQEFTARSLKLFCKDSCRLRTESWSFCCYPVLMFTNKLRRLNQLFSSWVTIMSGCFFFNFHVGTAQGRWWLTTCWWVPDVGKTYPTTGLEKEAGCQQRYNFENSAQGKPFHCSLIHFGNLFFIFVRAVSFSLLFSEHISTCPCASSFISLGPNWWVT